MFGACALRARSAAAETAAATAARAAASGTARSARTRDLRLAGQQPFALGALAGELAGPADRFRLLAGLLGGGLFVVSAELHLAENALALHLLLERLEGLVDVVVANENLHALFLLRLRLSLFGRSRAVTELWPRVHWQVCRRARAQPMKVGTASPTRTCAQGLAPKDLRRPIN